MKQLTKIGKIMLNDLLNTQVVDRAAGTLPSTLGKRLSKTQIKVMLYLHTLEVDKNGIIATLDISKAASTIQCTERAVELALDTLYRRCFIYYSKYASKKYSCYIPAYRQYFLTARNGGVGYIELSNTILTKVLEIKTVTQLRVALVSILKTDDERLVSSKLNKTAVSESSIHTVIKYDDYKLKLPRYMNSRYKIVQAVSATNMFELSDINSKYIITRLYKEYTYSNVRQALAEEYFKEYSALKLPYKLKTKEIEDLVQMSIQYSFELIKELLICTIYEYECDGSEDYFKLCAVIRNKVKQELRVA